MQAGCCEGKGKKGGPGTDIMIDVIVNKFFMNEIL